jgi:hypothetical protein
MPRSHDGDSGRRLPECMRCVLDHLAPGLPALPQLLLVRYGRHAHDPGCGIYPGLRSLSQDLRTSSATLRKVRDWLQARRRIQRLPRVGPHGADLLRLGPCDHCRQRDSMQLRCELCQRANLLHAETEWWAAQRDSMQSQKPLLQVVPIGTPVSRGGEPTDPAANGDGRAETGAGSRTPSGDRRQAADAVSNPSIPPKQAKAGNIFPFKADPPAPSDHAEPAAPHYAAAPSAATGGPVLHPGRLFEPEPEQDPARWAR